MPEGVIIQWRDVSIISITIYLCEVLFVYTLVFCFFDNRGTAFIHLIVDSMTMCGVEHHEMVIFQERPIIFLMEISHVG